MPNTSNVVLLRPEAIKNAEQPDTETQVILEDQPPPAAEPEAVSASFELSSSAQVLETARTLYNTPMFPTLHTIHFYDKHTGLYKRSVDTLKEPDYEMFRDEGVTGTMLPIADEANEADYVLMYNDATSVWGRYSSTIMPIPQLSKFFTQVMKKDDWKRHVFNTEGSQKSTFLYSVRIPKTRHASGVLPRVNVYVAANGITTPETDGITLLEDGLTNVAHNPDDMHTVSVDITSRPDLYILHHNDGSVEVQILSICSNAPLEIRGTTPDICITIRP